MPRAHSTLSRAILNNIGEGVLLNKLFRIFEVEFERKVVYDCLFRLEQQGLIVFNREEKNPNVILTADGTGTLTRLVPVRDNMWKIVIFDIPETKRNIRNTLRSKLKALGFKKWQESIWISPYKIDIRIEEEFKELAKHFFIRLIKTTEINYTEDLEKLFKD